MTTNRLNDAIALARTGNKLGARQVLVEVIRAEPTNEAAWLWLADTYTAEDDRARILEQCIRTIPTSQMARKALSMLKSREKTAPRPGMVPSETRPPVSGPLSPPTSPISRFPKPVVSEPGPGLPTEPPVVPKIAIPLEKPAPEPVVEQPEAEVQQAPDVVEETPAQEPLPVEVESQPEPVESQAEAQVVEAEVPAQEIEPPSTPVEEAVAPEPVQPPVVGPPTKPKRMVAPDMPFHVPEAREPEEQAPAASGFQSFFAPPIHVPPAAPVEPPVEPTQPPTQEEGIVEPLGEPEAAVEELETRPPAAEETLQETEPSLAGEAYQAEESLPEQQPAAQEQFTPTTIYYEDSSKPAENPAEEQAAGPEEVEQAQPAGQAGFLEEDDTEEFLRSFGPVQALEPEETQSEPMEEPLEPAETTPARLERPLRASDRGKDEVSRMDSSTSQPAASTFDWLEPSPTPAEEPAIQEQPAEPASIFGEGEPAEVSWLEELRGAKEADAADEEKAASSPPEFLAASTPPDREASSRVESWLTNIPEPAPWDEAPAKPRKPVIIRDLTPPGTQAKPAEPPVKPVETPVPPAKEKPEQEITLAPDDILLEQLRQEKPAPKPTARPPKAIEEAESEEEEKPARTDWLTIALIAAFVLVVILAVGFYLVWSRIRDQNAALSTLVASTQYAIETRIAAPTDTATPTITPTFSPTPVTPTMTFTPSTPTVTFTPTLTPEDPLAISPKNASSFMPVTAINTGSGEMAVSAELNFMAFWNPEDRKKAMKVDLWDLSSGSRIITLTGHENNIRAAAFSPNGRLLATGDEGGSIRLWDVPGGNQLFVMEVSKTRVNDLEFSPGGRFLASVTSDNTIRLWNTTNGQLLFALNFLGGQAENSPVPLNVAFSPNGRMVAAGTYGTIAIWSTSDGSLLKTLGEGVTGWNVSFSPDSQIIAEAGDGYVGLWNTGTGLAERRFPGAKKNKGLPPNYAFSPDGSKLVIEGSVDTPQLALWDVAMGIQLKAFDGGWSDTITGLFSPDGRILAGFGHTADNKYIAQLWDIETSSKLAGYENGFDLRFSPDGRRMLIRSGVIQLWTVPTAPKPGEVTPTP